MTNTFLEEYKYLIDGRHVIAGYWIRKEIQNLYEDLQDGRFIYDTTEAHKRIKFMQTCCLQSKQPYYMKPLELMPFQTAWWEAVYSFKMADTGLRRFTDGLLEIARKNGKSTMFAADGTYDLFVGEGGTDICCASNDDRQARLIWSEIGGMRSRLDPKKVLTGQNLTEIKNRRKNITVFRLSSKTQNKDGFNISKTYLDESHDIAEENGQSEIAEACWRGMSSKDEPLFLNCTTQGFNRECYLDNKISYAKRVIEGEIDDEHFIAFLFEQDSEAEIWQDESSWEKSNPSIRYGVKKINKLRRDVEAAKYDKATRIHLLTKDFNIPQSNAISWLMLEDYDYAQEIFDLEEFRGAFILGAVDLAATTDLANSKILLMRAGDKTKYVYTHYFIPESKLIASDDKEAGAEYKEWAKKGLLTIHDGNEIDISQVADWFYQLHKDYGLKPYKIGYDQRYAKTFLDRCNEYSFDTEMLSQGRALSNAMKLVEAELKSRTINYRSNEIDKWCLRNCCCEVDNVGNIQPVKAKTQKSKRIDGAVTLIMLFEMYRRYRTDFQTLINR
jgi:phage terminase large subunit-like protein